MAKSEELQRQTQRVLSDMGAPGKPVSARAAGQQLDIGYNQIADMLKGKAPAEKTLIRFAGAIGEAPADWLRYAGKLDVPVKGTDGGKVSGTGDSASDVEEKELQRTAQQIAKGLADVPKELRPLLIRQLRALIRAAASDSAK